MSQPPQTESLEGLWRETLRGILEDFHVPHHFSRVARKVEAHPLVRRLGRIWPELPPDHRRRAMEALIPLLREAALRSRPYCVRCGQCCRNSSPVLQQEDLPLFESGLIVPSDLVTLRRGEWGFSHMEGRPVRLEVERVKIKEHPGGGCIHYMELQRACSVYERRPHQCRIQACWDPQAEELLGRGTPLTRADLLPPDHPLMPAIREHEDRFGIPHLQGEPGRGGPWSRCERIVEEEREFRLGVMDHYGIEEAEMEFYFGRPLQVALHGNTHHPWPSTPARPPERESGEI